MTLEHGWLNSYYLQPMMTKGFVHSISLSLFHLEKVTYKIYSCEKDTNILLAKGVKTEDLFH